MTLVMIDHELRRGCTTPHYLIPQLKSRDKRNTTAPPTATLSTPDAFRVRGKQRPQCYRLTHVLLPRAPSVRTLIRSISRRPSSRSVSMSVSGLQPLSLTLSLNQLVNVFFCTSTHSFRWAGTGASSRSPRWIVSNTSDLHTEIHMYVHTHTHAITVEATAGTE